uniref:Uncharacterized protein n=1 Tax=Anopheles dirus TaxID=7168 RepID=A0A182NWW9_9DIPT
MFMFIRLISGPTACSKNWKSSFFRA